MINTKARNYLLATLAVLALFAGCKGESPTSPSSTPTPPGGQVTPPAGAAITLTVSNAQPQVDSSSVITATVTQSNQPVPNGTAVEFTTNLGTFTEVNSQSALRTTTNGVATVTLTSSTAGEATITATVNNVAKSTKVTFNLKPVVTPPPDLTPQITSVTPALGRPQGGEVLTINGKNFSSPKVVFDFGNGKTVEAFPVSVTPTQIQVLTPAVDLGAGQQKTAQIIVINNVGTPNEVRVTAGTTFTFQAEVLTPKITTVSPASGPTDGGTRVTIFGEGFQAPVQVFFGSAEAQLAAPVTFGQLVVIAPKSNLTNPQGSGLFTGPIGIRVVNINSATSVTADAVFRYISKMTITAVSPSLGPATGGTDIEIDGEGFTDQVTVDVGSATGAIRATVIGVFGSKILARTGRLASPCATLSGTIVVTNTENGDTATSSPPQGFSYFAINPFISSVTSTGALGSPLSAVITNPGVGLTGDAVVGLTLQATQLPTTPLLITNGPGPVTLSSTIPLNFTYPTASCNAISTIGTPLTGTQFVAASLTFTNATTGCTFTRQGAVGPPPVNPCVVPPEATASAAPACFPATTVGVTSGTTRTITITNTTALAGGQNLNITSATTTGDFTVAPSSSSAITPGSSRNFTVSFTPTATGSRTGTVVFATNDPAHPTITVAVCGTGS